MWKKLTQYRKLRGTFETQIKDDDGSLAMDENTLEVNSELEQR